MGCTPIKRRGYSQRVATWQLTGSTVETADGLIDWSLCRCGGNAMIPLIQWDDLHKRALCVQRLSADW